MEYKGTISYPSFFNDIADYIGNERWKKNKRNRDKNKTYSRGNKENEIKIDVVGTLAELIMLFRLFKKGNKFKYAMLLTKIRPDIKADVEIEIRRDDKILRTRFEVKAITGEYARVNVQSHKKKVCEHYIFIKPISNFPEPEENTSYAQYWIEDYLGVEGWATKDGAYNNPYYEKKIYADLLT
jgi:hypothetical protein